MQQLPSFVVLKKIGNLCRPPITITYLLQPKKLVITFSCYFLETKIALQHTYFLNPIDITKIFSITKIYNPTKKKKKSIKNRIISLH
jgi:hypothetical protein